MTSLTRPISRRNFSKTQRYAILIWCGVMSCILSALLLATPIILRPRPDEQKSADAARQIDPARYAGTVISRSPWDRNCLKYTIDNRDGRSFGAEEVGCPVYDLVDKTLPNLGPLDGARFRSVKKAFGGLQ